MSDDAYRIMLVDDEPLQLALVGRTLRADGYRVVSTDSSLGVTNTARSFQPHLMLLDVRIPELSGDRLVPLLRRITPDTLLILYSACDPDQLRRLASLVSADGWISKSDEIGKLSNRLKELIVKKAAARSRAAKPPSSI
jgi:DNA-binding response OmpR family regulator